jgi:hypothetical protein
MSRHELKFLTDGEGEYTAKSKNVDKAFEGATWYYIQKYRPKPGQINRLLKIITKEAKK